jgi:hypothetical protein
VDGRPTTEMQMPEPEVCGRRVTPKPALLTATSCDADVLYPQRVWHC